MEAFAGPAGRETTMRQAAQQELVERLAGAVEEDGVTECLAGVQVRRSSSPTELRPGVSYPSLCVIAQGSKEILLGGHLYRYDPAHYLIATIELPIATRIVEASEEHPYLSVLLELDATLVGSVMVEAGQPLPKSPTASKAIDVSRLDVNLLDAVVRLIRLLDSPGEARFLAPLIKREIVYRLLTGEQRERLGQIAVLSGGPNPIAEAVERLRTGFDQPLRIDAIAQEVGMSTSGFHHHFKTVTGISPLQFQKQLRLQAARHLMVAEHLDAAVAGYRVGYDDASHFNREYKRLFGAPPARDVQQLRGGESVISGI